MMQYSCFWYVWYLGCCGGVQVDLFQWDVVLELDYEGVVVCVLVYVFEIVCDYQYVGVCCGLLFVGIVFWGGGDVQGCCVVFFVCGGCELQCVVFYCGCVVVQCECFVVDIGVVVEYLVMVVWEEEGVDVFDGIQWDLEEFGCVVGVEREGCYFVSLLCGWCFFL